MAEMSNSKGQCFTYPLIGFAGYARSGKDTAADALAACGWTKLGFADPLYKQAIAVNPIIPMNSLEQAGGLELPYFVRLSDLVNEVGWTVAKTVKEVRRFLQCLGTEGGREIFGEDCWVRLAEPRLLACQAAVCFTNVRFANEVEMIHRHGGQVVWLERTGCQPVNEHKSEHQRLQLGLDDAIDAVLLNTGTKEELEHDARKFVGNLFGIEITP